MSRTASPERFNAQRHRVLEKAAELFAKKGFHSTTVEDIADGLNLTKAAIYYYVPTKQDILFELHDWVNQLLIEQLSAIIKTDDSPGVKLRKAIVMHVNTAVTEMSGVAALLQMQFALTGKARAAIIRKRDKYDKLLRGLIQDGIDQGVFVECDTAAVGFFIVGFINYVPHWYKSSGRLSKEAIGEMFADLVLRALLVDNGPEKLASMQAPLVMSEIMGDLEKVIPRNGS